MRRLLLIGGAAALIALPSVALADEPEQIDEPDPTAEAVAGTTTTDKALHAEGRGGFAYEGSGGTTVGGRGVVAVKDLSAAKDLVKTATGFGTTKTSKDGVWTRYIGEGTLTLDGSSYKVRVAGRFTSDVDPTATHPATGEAKAAGRGETIIKGGVPLPFWVGHRVLLTTGPMSVDLEGHGWRDGWWRGDRGHKGKHRARYVIVKRIVITRKVQNGHTISRRKVVTVKRRWDWDRRMNGATWRLNGPASGSVALTTVSGRLRVWDRSAAKDLAVTVPTGTTTTTLADGSVVYSGLRDAQVSLAGTGFRMKVRARDVEGTFTPAAGSLARSFVQGRGTIDTGTVTDYAVRKHRGVRVLLQPAPAK
jgi:hypothetical protein